MSKSTSTAPTPSSSSYSYATNRPTVANFEKSLHKNNRAPFKEILKIIGDAKASYEKSVVEYVASNPLLNILNDSDLLFFSTEHRATTAESIKAKPGSQCDENQDLVNVVLASLHAIDIDFLKNNSNLSQAFLITSAEMLVGSKALQESGELDSYFEGLSIEAIPSFNGTRSDDYNYIEQQTQICFQALTAPLDTPHLPSLLLAHEFTHAIDDSYRKVNSAAIVFENLHRNAPKDKDKQMQILECAANLVDDTQALTAGYLPGFKRYLLKKNVGVDVAEHYTNLHKENTESASAIADTRQSVQLISDRRIFQNDEGALECTSVLPEFLTFSIENVFQALKKSETVQEFEKNYTERVNILLERTIGKYPDSAIRAAALELILDSTKPYLDLIKDKTTFPELQNCCDITSRILEENYIQIKRSISAKSSSVSNAQLTSVIDSDLSSIETYSISTSTATNSTTTITSLFSSVSSSSSMDSASASPSANSAKKRKLDKSAKRISDPEGNGLDSEKLQVIWGNYTIKRSDNTPDLRAIFRAAQDHAINPSTSNSLTAVVRASNLTSSASSSLSTNSISSKKTTLQRSTSFQGRGTSL